MTSPKTQAKKLAEYGRGGDDVLMHVSRDEVQALSQYGSSIGRPITINPDTGLPEAFSFGDIAKIAALAGATYLTGGMLAPYTSAAMGSTMGGLAANTLAGAGVSKLANPEMSTGQALMNGVGGAMIGSGLGALGGKIGEFGAEAAGASMTGAGGEAAAGAAMPSGMDAFGANAVAPGSAPAAPGVDSFGANSIAPGSVPMEATGPLNAPMMGMERGVQNPGEFASTLGKQGALGDIGRAGIGASMINLESGRGDDEEDASGTYYTYDVQGSPIVKRSGSAEDTYGKRRRVDFAHGGRVVDPMARSGDGVSDGVPAMIDGEQRAAIASGEYIIPARAVSAAGNGSTMAGAKKFDALTNDLIRQQKGAGLSRAPKMDMDKARKKAKV